MTLGLGRLAGKAFWALVDQALFSTANFVQNLVLARWLSPMQYGLFSVLYATLLLVGVLHTALLTEPMTVFGPGRFRGRLSGYLQPLTRWHIIFSTVMGLVGGLVGLLLFSTGETDLAPGVLALALALSPILFLWLMRRACYVKMEVFQAALGSLLYAALMGLGITFSVVLGLLSSITALASMAVASLVTGLWLQRVLRRSWSSGGEPGGLSINHEARSAHKQYGTWAVVTGIAVWVPENASHLLFPAIGQIELSAALRAVWNLVVPIAQVNAALGQVLLPIFVRKRAQADFHRSVLMALLVLSGLSLGYAAALALAGPWVFHVVYANKYSEYANLLWVAALLPLGSAVKTVYSQALRAMEQPQSVLWAYLPSILVTFTVGFGLTLAWGVVGTLLGKLVASGATGLALAALYYVKARDGRQVGVEMACMPAEEGRAEA